MASVSEMLQWAQTIQERKEARSWTNTLARSLGAAGAGFLSQYKTPQERELSKAEAQLKLLAVEKKEHDAAVDKAFRESSAFKSAFDIVNDNQFAGLGEAKKPDLDTTGKGKVDRLFKTSISFPFGSGRVSLTEKDAKAGKLDIRQREKDIITKARTMARDEQARRLQAAGKFDPQFSNINNIFAPAELERKFQNALRARFSGDIIESDRLIREIEKGRKRQQREEASFGSSDDPNFEAILPEK